MRFYHEKFQKDKPELLHQIKRATKTDQQSKDEVESLRQEISKLKEGLAQATQEYDRKLAELSYDCNRRISALTTDYDKLALLVHQSVTATQGTGISNVGAASQDLLHSLSQAAMSLQSHLRPGGNASLPLPTQTPSDAMESSSNKKAKTGEKGTGKK